MKINKTVISLEKSVLLFDTAYVADASNSLIKFNRSMIQAPYSIATESTEQTVDLGQVNIGALTESGQSKPKAFVFSLENCALDTKNTVQATFTAHEASNSCLGISDIVTVASIALTYGTDKILTLSSETVAKKWE